MLGVDAARSTLAAARAANASRLAQAVPGPVTGPSGYAGARGAQSSGFRGYPSASASGPYAGGVLPNGFVDPVIVTAQRNAASGFNRPVAPTLALTRYGVPAQAGHLAGGPPPRAWGPQPVLSADPWAELSRRRARLRAATIQSDKEFLPLMAAAPASDAGGGGPAAIGRVRKALVQVVNHGAIARQALAAETGLFRPG